MASTGRAYRLHTIWLLVALFAALSIFVTAAELSLRSGDPAAVEWYGVSGGTADRLTPDLPLRWRADAADAVLGVRVTMPPEHARPVALRIRYRDRSKTPFVITASGVVGRTIFPVSFWTFGEVPDLSDDIRRFSRKFELSGNQFELRLAGKWQPLDIEILDISVEAVKSQPLRSRYIEHLPIFAAIILLGLCVYWGATTNPVIRQWVLVAMSGAFLLYLNAAFAVVLVGVVGVTYAVGCRLATTESPKLTLLLLAIFGLLVFLIAFKYFAAELTDMFAWIGTPVIVVPLGLSYFVFRLIHGVLTWYRGQETGVTLREFLAYVLFLPTLPAGPIETLKGFREKRCDRLERADVAFALRRVAFGAGKKIVIADALIAPLLFDPVSGFYQRVVVDGDPITSALAVGLLAAAFLYVYVDFSAYSDIAIGLSRLFGYRIVENFSWPIFSRNLRLFWQSWHISLSDWCRREIYFPILAGTRSNVLALYCAMLTIGFWHNLDANWLSWAIHHGTGLSLLAVWNRVSYPYYQSLPSILRLAWDAAAMLLTFLFVCWGFSFVIIQDWSIAWRVYAGALSF